jgi:hypothetical protein
VRRDERESETAKNPSDEFDFNYLSQMKQNIIAGKHNRKAARHVSALRQDVRQSYEESERTIKT